MNLTRKYELVIVLTVAGGITDVGVLPDTNTIRVASQLISDVVDSVPNITIICVCRF